MLSRRSVPRKKKSSNKFLRYLAIYNVVVGLVVCLSILKLVRDEINTSKLQAKYLSAISQKLGFSLNKGPSSSIRFPEYGPYDQRLGYTLLPDVIKRLETAGYRITSQATFSPMMTELADYGLFNIYHEKAQAGLRITDKSDQVIFNAIYPVYGYPDFKSVPPVIMDTLVYIENRELLGKDNVTVNPAIEWDRLGFAGIQLMAQKVGATKAIPGGSTLATQLEKYRHSNHGYTNGVVDKFRQMGTASLRAYMMGPDTRAMRQEIALSYLNSMPLAATAKSGEIHGLGDGLTAWFGADIKKINRLLSADAIKPPKRISHEQAIAYRQVLSIFLSQRRPSYLLGSGYDALQRLTDKYLNIMSKQGIISNELKEAALKASSVRPSVIESTSTQFFTEKKTQNVLRARLANALGVKSNYDLDRFDLTVKSTLDFKTQQDVMHALKKLSQPEEARNAGIMGFRMLNDSTNLKPIVYSLMLFEKSKVGNLLRVQTDNYDQPLDINEGIRIDLGSTSKFRTMVHYLELITDVYQQHKGFSSKALSQIVLHPKDNLSAWVIAQLIKSPKISLEDLLNNALDKSYSASPGEYFFTGGGLHHFNNFTPDEDGRVMSIRNALKDSVNLVFIRLMREIVYHHLYKPDGIARWLDSDDSPKRQEYLQRFADNEGQVYLNRFYARYEGKTPEEALDLLTKRVFPKASRFTMLFRAINADADEMALGHFLHKHLEQAELEGEDVYDLYNKYSVDKFDLQDQGYITKIHPLELWLVGYLTKHPDASRKEVIAASVEPRQDVYRWLFNNHRKNAQQQRIMTLLEEEAFNKIHEAWKRVGYPFEELTPSYATSIGASGDRPAALADLMGIIVNDGIRLPAVRFESLHYAEGTPYETNLKKAVDPGERIFAPEIAKVSRGALMGVVVGGTAARLNNVYTNADGVPLPVGGKTGTGDHRKQSMNANGEIIETKFISRAATFTFFIGERYFGVITAYVEGDNAGQYHFTSSLPVQIVKFLKPVLSPLINNTPIPKLADPFETNIGNAEAVVSTPLNVDQAIPQKKTIALVKTTDKPIDINKPLLIDKEIKPPKSVITDKPVNTENEQNVSTPDQYAKQLSRPHVSTVPITKEMTKVVSTPTAPITLNKLTQSVNEKPVNKVVTPNVSQSVVKSPTQQITPSGGQSTSIIKAPAIQQINKVNPVVVDKQVLNPVQTPSSGGQVTLKSVQSGALQQPKLVQPSAIKSEASVVTPITQQKPEIKLVPKLPKSNVVNKQSPSAPDVNPSVGQSVIVEKPATAPKNESSNGYYRYPTAPATSLAR